VRVDCALLCDAASARDGLLFVLGGGVTRLFRPEYPAPLGVALALRVMVHPTEGAKPHVCEARLIAEDGQTVGGFEIEFGIANPNAGRPGEELSAVFALPLQGLPLPGAGAYSFELLIDGVHQASVPFVAEVQRADEAEDSEQAG
jgi:hypothetical protein